MNKLRFEVTSGVAVLTLDNPPVNSLGHELREALVAAVQRANDDAAIEVLIVIGAGAGFSGGADIREFGTPKAAAYPNLRSVISEFEDSAKPIIAAIGGVCMGGGLELALGCHFRVGVPGARIALPEVKLGLLPGAGGTQRLPRLLGVEPALNLIVSGATVPSEKLRGTPLFDAFGDGDLRETALSFARRVVTEKLPRRRVRDLPLALPNAESFFQFARNTVKAAAGPYPAPLACVEAVAAAVDRPFEAGLKRERELFTTLMLSPESAALRHLFQAERAASHIEGVPDDTPLRQIRKVGVIGAGTMGGGITMSFINAGLPVVLLETQQDALDRGLANIRRNYQGALRKGTLNEATPGAAPGADHADLGLRLAAGCRFVHRGGVREHGREAHRVRDAGRSGAAGRDSRLQYLGIESRPDCGIHAPPAGCDRSALLQPGQCDASARSGARRQDRARCAGQRHAPGQDHRQGRGGVGGVRRLHRQSHVGAVRPGRS